MKYLPRRLHLQNRTDFERCTDKVNSGISRSQRLLNNGNHLCSFRIQRQDAFGRRDAERVWTGSRKRRSQQCAHIAGFLAEMKRFELLRRFEADLPHFECGPFNHLGTSPYKIPVKGTFCEKFLFSENSLEQPLEPGLP